MPVHDWLCAVEAGIFHDFHHGWIDQIKSDCSTAVSFPQTINWPLAEQHTSHFGPDVLTLQMKSTGDADPEAREQFGYGLSV